MENSTHTKNSILQLNYNQKATHAVCIVPTLLGPSNQVYDGFTIGTASTEPRDHYEAFCSRRGTAVTSG